MQTATGQLFGANINRSPASYDKNEPELLDLYPEGNTDKNMTVLYVTDNYEPYEPVALFNWFAVHPVAMNKSNTLINGDVKGGVAMWFRQNVFREKWRLSFKRCLSPRSPFLTRNTTIFGICGQKLTTDTFGEECWCF